MSGLQDRILTLQSRINSLEATITSLRAQNTASPPPSALAIAFATGLLGALAGYFYSQGTSLFSSTSSRAKSSKPTSKKSWPNSYDVTVHPDSSDEELMNGLTGGKDGIAPSTPSSASESNSDEPQSDLSTFSGSTEEHKLTLLLRSDLGMTKGKMAAQASHATLANYRTLLAQDPNHPVLKRWERGGQAKVALRVDSEEEMSVLQAQAVSLGLCANVVRDAGRTQIAAGSVTALGVGPGPRSVVDKVTGGLKLL